MRYAAGKDLEILAPRSTRQIRHYSNAAVNFFFPRYQGPYNYEKHLSRGALVTKGSNEVYSAMAKKPVMRGGWQFFPQFHIKHLCEVVAPYLEDGLGKEFYIRKEILALRLGQLLLGKIHVPDAYEGTDKEGRPAVITATIPEYIDAESFDYGRPFYVNDEGITCVRIYDNSAQEYASHMEPEHVGEKRVFGRIDYKYWRTTGGDSDVDNFRQNMGISVAKASLVGGLAYYPVCTIDHEYTMPTESQKKCRNGKLDDRVEKVPWEVATGIVRTHLKDLLGHVSNGRKNYEPFPTSIDALDMSGCPLIHRVQARQNTVERYGNVINPKTIMIVVRSAFPPDISSDQRDALWRCLSEFYARGFIVSKASQMLNDMETKISRDSFVKQRGFALNGLKEEFDKAFPTGKHAQLVMKQDILEKGNQCPG